MNEQGKITFIRLSPETEISELKSELTKIVAKNNIKRVCFDPISIVALNVENEAKIREIIFDVASLMKRLNVTCLFADESMEGMSADGPGNGQWNRTDIMKFLVDGVVTFHDSGLSGVGDRAIRIVKMRRTKHQRGPQGMQISDTGIDVMPNA
jgi:circadian clock protein KaiC